MPKAYQGDTAAMPKPMRMWIFVLLVLPAVPLHAQEWVYCPAAPQELERQCRESAKAIRRNQDLLAVVGDQMRNPEIVLAKVDRRPNESVTLYQARVKQQQGVAAPVSNRWLPVRGRYYDPDRQVMYVALDRQDYWRYVWEALAPDEDLARRTFTAREQLSRQFKQSRFTGPGGKLDQWVQEMEAARRFQQECCRHIPPPTVPSETDPSLQTPRP